MVTIEQLARWLEEDGHPACAGDLLTAPPGLRAAVARQAADCAENDPDVYDDGMARALPGQLREWADQQAARLANIRQNGKRDMKVRAAEVSREPVYQRWPARRY